MFDILFMLISSIATFVFPVFASYKALKSPNPSALTPWLMYWVVVAIVLFIESWTSWFLSYIPFYHLMRAIFFLWLVLPQTQGATHLYLTQVHPFLQKHERSIEEFIGRAHEQAKAAGLMYLKRLIEAAKQALFGNFAAASAAAAPPPPPSPPPSNYAQSLFSRWSVPPLAPQLATDFYTFLSSAMHAGATHDQAPLIPAEIKGKEERSRYLELQGERLRSVLDRLERERENVAGEQEIGRSRSLGNLSDFEQVDPDEGDAGPPPLEHRGSSWFGSWGKREGSAEKEE